MDDDIRQGAVSLIGSSVTIFGMRAALAYLISRELGITYRSAWQRVVILTVGSYLVGRNFKSGQLAAIHYVNRFQEWLEITRVAQAVGKLHDEQQNVKVPDF
jgi:hypothetical protein